MVRGGISPAPSAAARTRGSSLRRRGVKLRRRWGSTGADTVAGSLASLSPTGGISARPNIHPMAKAVCAGAASSGPRRPRERLDEVLELARRPAFVQRAERLIGRHDRVAVV